MVSQAFAEEAQDEDEDDGEECKQAQDRVSVASFCFMILARKMITSPPPSSSSCGDDDDDDDHGADADHVSTGDGTSTHCDDDDHGDHVIWMMLVVGCDDDAKPEDSFCGVFPEPCYTSQKPGRRPQRQLRSRLGAVTQGLHNILLQSTLP